MLVKILLQIFFLAKINFCFVFVFINKGLQNTVIPSQLKEMLNNAFGQPKETHMVK